MSDVHVTGEICCDSIAYLEDYQSVYFQLDAPISLVVTKVPGGLIYGQIVRKTGAISSTFVPDK